MGHQISQYIQCLVNCFSYERYGYNRVVNFKRNLKSSEMRLQLDGPYITLLIRTTIIVDQFYQTKCHNIMYFQNIATYFIFFN